MIDKNSQCRVVREYSFACVPNCHASDMHLALHVSKETPVAATAAYLAVVIKVAVVVISSAASPSSVAVK